MTGQPKLPVMGFPWWPVTALSPVVPLFGEMAEMRYLWREPLVLDDRKLRAFLGEVPHTPLDTAIAASLRGVGVSKTLSQREGAARRGGWRVRGYALADSTRARCRHAG